MTDSDTTCPICDVEITAIRQIGPVTYVLTPCGHQIDDNVYEDRFGD